MKNWLELIPISARVHKRGSRMTRTCIALAVFLMAALFGMADRYLQGERAWQIRAYGSWQFTGEGDASQIYAVALFLAFLVMAAAVLMISGSLNGNVLQRTEFFGMLASQALSYAAGGCLLGWLPGIPIQRILFLSLITSFWQDTWNLPLLPLAGITGIVLASSLLAVVRPFRSLMRMSVVDVISRRQG